MKILSWFSVIVTVLIVGFVVNENYKLYRDIESVAHRAQVAADAEDMLHYMKTFKTNMELHRITTGYSALIFKQPSNDLFLLYASVNNIISRLEQVKDLPKSDTAYQVALDDLRGTIRELEEPTLGVIWTRYWVLYLFWIWPLVHLFRFDFF